VGIVSKTPRRTRYGIERAKRCASALGKQGAAFATELP
jgi:hypothetical protein